MGHYHKVPMNVLLRVIEDINKYREEHNVGDGKVAKQAGVCQSLISKWRKGQGKPSLRSVIKLKEGGITDIELPEELKQKIIQGKLELADKGNMPPRLYRKRVGVPAIISNQVKLLLDDHMNDLKTPKMYDEFLECKEEFIRKVYYLCRQG